MRAWKSSMFSNTTARPRCLQQVRRRGRRLDDRAVRREVAAQHRDAGVRLERLVERLDHLAVPARRVGDVLADGLAVDGQRVRVEHVPRSPSSPRAGRRRSRSLPSGTCPRAAGSPGRAAREPSWSQSSSSSSTPSRPAMASRWITALVEPPIAALAGWRSRTPARVRILRQPQVLLTISTMRRPVSCASR